MVCIYTSAYMLWFFTGAFCWTPNNGTVEGVSDSFDSTSDLYSPTGLLHPDMQVYA